MSNELKVGDFCSAVTDVGVRQGICANFSDDGYSFKMECESGAEHAGLLKNATLVSDDSLWGSTKEFVAEWRDKNLNTSSLRTNPKPKF